MNKHSCCCGIWLREGGYANYLVIYLQRARGTSQAPD